MLFLELIDRARGATLRRDGVSYLDQVHSLDNSLDFFDEGHLFRVIELHQFSSERGLHLFRRLVFFLNIKRTLKEHKASDSKKSFTSAAAAFGAPAIGMPIAIIGAASIFKVF